MTKTIASIQDIVLGPRDRVVLEYAYTPCIAIHVVRQPNVGEKGFYRAAISMGAWDEREVKNYVDKFYTKRKPCPRHWSVKYETKYMHPLDYQNIPIIEHDTLWDFYKYVGYDYKTQKYAKVTENA